jgi:hypothetical protein
MFSEVWLESTTLECLVARQKLSCGRVGRKGNIMHIALAKQHIDIRLVGVFPHGITEKNYCMNLPFCDARCNLSITTKRTAGKAFDGYALARNSPPCGAGPH